MAWIAGTSPFAGLGWNLVSETRYIYDGMRLFQERDLSNVPLVICSRGSDPGGTFEGLPRERVRLCLKVARSSPPDRCFRVPTLAHLPRGQGGIGGLLARSSGYSGGNWTTNTFYFADGNGSPREITPPRETYPRKRHADCASPTAPRNLSHGEIVTYLLDSLQGLAASYRYAFGNTISSSGPLAAANVYRFSSKEFHANSGDVLLVLRSQWRF